MVEQQSDALPAINIDLPISTSHVAFFCEIPLEDLEFYNRCGGGAFGQVYRARWISKGCEVAVKRMLALDKEVCMFIFNS